MSFLVRRNPDRAGPSKMVPGSPPFATLFTRRGVPFTSKRAGLSRLLFAPSRMHTIGSAITAVTGVTSTDTLTKTTHGLPNGANVVLSSLVQSNPALDAAKRFADMAKGGLFVVNQTANTFQLAVAPGGPVVDLGTDITSVTVQRVGSAAPIT